MKQFLQHIQVFKCLRLFQMIFVYNKDDKYIGTLEDFKMYIEKYGLSEIQTYNNRNGVVSYQRRNLA